MITVEEAWGVANIAEDLDDDQLREIADEVVQGYDTDVASSQPWRDAADDYIKLASQIVDNKTFPWPGAANVNYPLLTTAAVNFASRAYPALIPAYSPVRGRVIGFDETGEKQQRAIRIGKHMSYQLMEQMPEWEDDMDKLCMILPIVGTVFKKTYYDDSRGVNISEMVLPQDLIVEYYAKSLEDARRKTHKLYLNNNDIYERVQTGLYLECDLTDATPDEDRVKDQKYERQEPTPDENTPRLVLEQHTFLDLDHDGYAEPYIVTVDHQDRKVLRIAARYDLDGIVRDEDEIVRIEPVEYFTKFEFIPSPDGGFYGLGYGPLLGPINATVNTTINQLMDAGTLSNMGGGFLGRGIKIRGGAHKFKPGEWKSIPSSGNDIRNSVFPLPVREPSPTLFNLMSAMINAGERLGGTTDMQVGENPGQNQKATTTMAVLDQGMKIPNAVHKRMHRQLRKEYRKIFRLNKLFLSDQQYFQVLDPRSEEIIQIMSEDYNTEDMDVMPASDPSTSTEQQRLMKAQSLLELMPMGLNQQEVIYRVLEAMEQPGIERLMDVPPSPPPFEQVMEQERFAFEQQQYAVDTMLKAAEMQEKSINDRANSLAKLITAEAKEAGLQIDVLKTELDALAQEETQFKGMIEQVRAMVTPQGGEDGSGNEQGGVPSVEE